MFTPTSNFNLDTDPLLACYCCNECNIQPRAIANLQLMRDDFGKPIYITSGWRCSKHPKEEQKPTPGQHYKGLAFDISVSSIIDRYELVKIAMNHGANGIGIGEGFIHVDWRFGNNVIWTY